MLLRIQEQDLRAAVVGVMRTETHTSEGEKNSVAIALWLALIDRFAAVEPEALTSTPVDPVREMALRFALDRGPDGSTGETIVRAAGHFEQYLRGERA